MKCEQCGTDRAKRTASMTRPYRYTWSGLGNVLLVGIPVYVCKKCGSEIPVIPKVDQLHRLILKVLMHKPSHLTGAELRFLRKQAEYAAHEFAALLGVSPEHLSRVENGRVPVSAQVDKLARAIIRVSENKDVKDVLLRVVKSLGEPQGEPVLKLTGEKWTEVRAA